MVYHFLKTQMNCSSLYDRMKKLLVSYEWSDCSFSFSGKELKAHKLILGISSPVFEAMFYGPLATSDNVSITDIEPDIFQLLLNYIYTDKVEISSIEEAIELMYAAKKYLLDELKDICIEYVKTNLSIDNVISILSYPQCMQDECVVPMAVMLFCTHADYLLQENKEEMSPDCVKTIVASDKMNLKEKDLIKHIFEWSQIYCEQNNLSVSIESRRSVLIKNDIFKHLRFITLSIDDLNEIMLDKHNVLLPPEVDYLKRTMNNPGGNKEKDDSYVIGFIHSTRLALTFQWNLCHRNSLKSVAPFFIDSNNHMIQSRIKASRTVFVRCLYVPTRMAPVFGYRNNTEVYSEQISVSIISEPDNNITKFTNFMNTVEYDSTIIIELSEPCIIKKDKWYRIEFVWPQNRGLTYSYAVACRAKYFKDNRLTIEFEDVTLNPSCYRGSGSFISGLKYSV